MSTAVLSDDSQAIALLCGRLGDRASDADAKPLTAREWSSLAGAIHRSPLGRPGALLGLTADDLADQFSLDTHQAERCALLLQRGGAMAIELDRLAARGIWLVTRADDAYPRRLRERLGSSAPPVLFGSGDRSVLGSRGVAILGSRDADDAATSFAQTLGRHCAANGVCVYSGAARGVDRSAMNAACEAGGAVVGFVADALETMIRRKDLREFLAGARLALLTPFRPDAGFRPGNAMARNKLVYASADAAVVVASGDGGGTWTGATENLRARWVPLFVRADSSSPPGNRLLLERGANPVELGQLLSGNPLHFLERQINGGRADAPVGPNTPDLFELVWPHLQTCLRAPVGEKRVAEQLGLTQGQARAWLVRAVQAGLVEASGKPRKYRLPKPQPETLFEP